MKKLILTALAFAALTLSTYAQAADEAVQTTNGQVQNNATAIDTLPGETFENSSIEMEDRGAEITEDGAADMDGDAAAKDDDKEAKKAMKAEKKAAKQQMKADKKMEKEATDMEEADPTAMPEEPQMEEMEESSDVPN